MGNRTFEMLGYVEGALVNRQVDTLGKGGIARVEKAAQGCEQTLAALQDAFATAESHAQQRLDQWGNWMLSANVDAAEEKENQLSLRAMIQAEANQELADFHTVSDEAIKNAHTDINTFKKEIQTGLALAGPISYWETKATKHHQWFWVSSIVFVALATVFLCLVGWEGKDLLREIQENELAIAKERAKAEVSAPPPSTGSTTLPAPLPAATPATPQLQATPQPDVEKASAVSAPHLLRFGILILGTTIGIWLLRFVARILLSNLHLKDDAQERAVMIKSFLALMKSEVNISPEDVKLALSSIFRPATTGLVKDDGVPPGVWDIVTRLKGGKGAD